MAVLGWREWFALPDLGIEHIKGKVDSGARSSVLHTTAIQVLGGGRVRFLLRRSRNSPQEQWCEAELLGHRWVTDSGGHRELRPFIRTGIAIGTQRWDMEVSLTARDTMRFRLLVGRTALAGRFLIDPQQSYCCGRFRP